MADLPTVMLTEYNGYEFPSNVETTLYQVTPHYDAAKRAVTYCDFTIELRWYLTHESLGQFPILVKQMVQALTAPAGILKYTERGLGLNGPKDIDYGPKPQDLTIRPHGRTSVECRWRCHLSVPVCDDARFSGIREWCYTVSYSIDRLRNTTITTKGHLIIAGGRSKPGDRTITVSADEYLEKVVPPRRLGFRRESDSHELSEDRLRLDYTSVDVQLGQNTPGEGLLDAIATETVSSENIWAKYTRAIESEYVVAPGHSVDVAWKRFAATVKDRVNAIKAQLPKAVVIPVSFSATDPEVYGQNVRVKMRLSFYVVLSGNVADILSNAIADATGKMGLWRPVPESDARTFLTSTNKDKFESFGPRGSAGIRFAVADDKIVDLCGPVPAVLTTPPSSGGIQIGGGNYPGGRPAFAGGIRVGVQMGLAFMKGIFPKPTQQSSWLHYEQQVHVSVDIGRVMSKMLPKDSLSQPAVQGPHWDVSNNQLPVTDSRTIPETKQQQQQQNNEQNTGTFTHQRTQPVVHVWLRGRALRYGYSIPQPQLISVRGRAAILLNTGAEDEGFTTSIVSAKEYPIVGARWNLHYIVPGLTELSADDLPNPMMGT